MANIPPGFEDLAPSEEIFNLICRDDLTGLYNRRFFARYMKQVADWSEDAPPVALAMIDMDNLKRINDRLGHMSGDASLKRIGAIMLEMVGEEAYPVRYAGDEFCLVLPGMLRDEALELCEALRVAVAKDDFEGAGLPDGLRPSLSVGVAQFPTDAPSGGDELTEAADQALYVSKRTGKNKVTSAAALKGGETQELVADLDALRGFPSRSLIGREAAFRAVDDALSVVLDGHVGFLLLEGAAGVGKTRLLSEVGKYGKERGLAVLIERCSAVTREEPYKTLGQLLDGYLRRDPSRVQKAAGALKPVQRVALREVLPILPPPPRRGPPGRRPPGARPGPTPPNQRRPAPEGARPPGTGPQRRGPGPTPPNPQRRPQGGPPATGPERLRPARPRASDEPAFADTAEGATLPRPPREDTPRRSDRLPAASGEPARPAEGEAPRPADSGAARPAASRRASGGGPTPGGAPAPGNGPPPAGAPRGRRPGPAGPGPRRGPPPARPLDPAELTVALFAGLQELLRVLSREQPLLVLLDDMEASDEATLELITRSIGGPGRVLFVGTARPEATSEAGAEEPPYAAFRRNLDQVPGAARFEVAPLEAPDAARLASQLLDGWSPPAEFAERLFAISGGVPLLVEGILRHQVDTGRLKREGEAWQVKEPLPSEAPITLEEVLRLQLAILDTELSALLHDAAVVGPNFQFNVLRATAEAERPAGETTQLVDRAVEAGALREGAPGADGERQLEFPSRAAHEAAYEAADPAARQAAHERVGDALAASGSAAAAVAYHYAKAAQPTKREQFAAKVRARRQEIFDREALETLLTTAGVAIPEVVEPAPEALQAVLPELARVLATALKVVRVFPAGSKVVGDALEELTTTLASAHELMPAFTIAHRGNAFVLNGKPVDKAYGEGQFQEAVVTMYRVNQIKSLTFCDPPSYDELLAFLAETAKHGVAVPLEPYFWRVFAMEKELQQLGVAQKAPVLQHKRTGAWRSMQAEQRIAKQNMPLVRELVRHLMGSVERLRKHPREAPPCQAALDSFEAALRRLFEKAPGLAIHMGEDGLVHVNGTPLDAQAALASGGAGLVQLLREHRLRGLVILPDVTRDELTRFGERVAQLEPGPAPASAKDDPVTAIGEDPELPNVLVGAPLFQLAHDLVRKAEEAETRAEEPDRQQKDLGFGEELPIELLLPLVERDPDLPPDFEWPSDAVCQQAHRLYRLKPHELLTQSAAEFGEVLEVLLLDPRSEAHEVVRRLIERVSVNFASQETFDRQKAAELFIGVSKRATQELRARFFPAVCRRLCDALEIEVSIDVYERLSECARLGLLDRIAEADWDTAARLARSLGVRRQTRGGDVTALKKVSERLLGQVLSDPRCDRLFETLELGSEQERRKAVRVLESMGQVAAERLVRALGETTRGRVEVLIIDMLAALVPASEQALRKEISPMAEPAPLARYLRAAAVVCPDASPLFVAGVQSADQQVQLAALAEARKVGGKVAQSVLKWALANGSLHTQLAAVRHLGELARAEAVDDLIALLQSASLVEIQRECCLALGKLSLNKAQQERVIPVLTSFLRAGGFLRAEHHEDVRHAAALALGSMTDVEAARRALERVLDDKDKRVRLTAKLKLDELGQAT